MIIITMKQIYKISFWIVFLAFFLQACVEEVAFETQGFENALVIEATITNEEKTQTILLSRTFMFEEEGPLAEQNAEVTVTGGGVTYNFNETTPGIYTSDQTFGAVINIDYQLTIRTSNGRVYTSTIAQLPQSSSQFENVFADRITNDNDEDGISISVDSFDPDRNSNYYRFKYEETFKIIAPLWRNVDIIVTNDEWPDCDFGFEDKTEEQEICYGTQNSNTFVLATTTSFGEDRLTRFPVRFLNNNNYIISHRYSILVKQFIISREAFTYFETLNNLSGEESLFSQSQPGFLPGNIKSQADENELVIGFFDVSVVSENRLFFNYSDFYPNNPLPPYINACELISPSLLTTGEGTSCPLINVIKQQAFKYVRDNTNPDDGEGPVYLADTVCGDCRELGSVIPPDFWIE